MYHCPSAIRPYLQACVLVLNSCIFQTIVQVYTGKHLRALRKGSQLVLMLARATLEIRERESTETNEDLAGCQPCNPACAKPS